MLKLLPTLKRTFELNPGTSHDQSICGFVRHETFSIKSLFCLNVAQAGKGRHFKFSGASSRVRDHTRSDRREIFNG